MSHEREHGHVCSITRRGFLKGLGTGAAGAAGAVVLPDSASAQTARAPQTVTRSDRFTRMFPDLPPFAEPNERLLSALRELGARGGPMDANDPLHEGPVRLITNPELSPDNRDNTTMTAGVTFFGQFLDHDMTFDAGSPLGVPVRPERSVNSRTPTFDLDSVYGRGPVSDSHLYDPQDRALFRVEQGGTFEDIPRTADATAIIPDPRNDEHLIIAGLQSAFLLFHNRVVDMLRQGGAASLTALGAADGADDQRLSAQTSAARGSGRDNAVFVQARRLVTWHYQWMILHEFLPTIVGAPLVNEILAGGRRFYRPVAGEAAMPVEFQGAAYRFGHSLVRPSYRANLAGQAGEPFFGFIFDPAEEGQTDPNDLRGGCRAARRFVGWQTFFNFGGTHEGHVRPNKTIDTRLSTPLFDLPLGAIASGEPPTSLAQRNLLRQVTWSLPSGQALARAMGIAPIPASDLADLAGFGVGLETSTPLWYYVLKEAELAGGARLVGVGARIVAEVMIGLLQQDPDSYLSNNPRWRPTLPGRAEGAFTMVDLLTFAGVDPDSRGQ
jgi:hypothetical protein